MDEYLKIKLDKMKPEQRDQAIKYMLGVKDSEKARQAQEIKLSLVSDYTEQAIELNKTWGEMQGLSTGYPKLDRLTRGLVGGELIVLAGKTSYGKTTLAINVANQVALTGIPVLFVSLEMTHAEIASRYMNINGGDTDNYHAVAALTAMQANDELNWKSVDPLVRYAKEEMGVGLIVIDHLHYFTRELENVAEDIGRITKEFKKNAIRHALPVVLISHVRKTGTKTEAAIEDLRGSSYIAQDADIVLMVARDEADEHLLGVRIDKNRNRGFDFKNNVAELYLDKIKVYNDKFDTVFGPENKTAPQSPEEQPNATEDAVLPLF
jgi:replicative DNA helicase